MLGFLPGPLRGVLTLSLMILNTLVLGVPVFVVALVKFLVPLQAVRTVCNRLLNWLATLWISTNNGILAITTQIRWHVEGLEALSTQEWYLVLSNHRSWADILVLQKLMNRRIPLLKFFLKQQLIWVPILGLSWWALDYPFMKRHSKSYLAKHPEMKGKDMETTRKACEKFRTLPVSIMNFVEGTRFTKEKHQRSNSPFRNLLKPKAGGVGYVLTAMGEQLHRVLDVTIVYPGASRSFWEFLCGQVMDVRAHVRVLPITEELLGNYEEDNAYRARLQKWLNELWTEKDARIERMMLGS